MTKPPEILGTHHPPPSSFKKTHYLFLAPKNSNIWSKKKYVAPKSKNIAPNLKYVAPNFKYLIPNSNN